ncbi:ligase-associated DNA damage response exonuclease [Salinarchaeum chitinilyticum]
MRGSVSLGDGVRIETEIGTVVADGKRPDGDVAVCSHAHTDHLPSGHTAADSPTVCSALTATLAGVRQSSELSVADHPAVTLLPAGHVAGSRAALIDDGETRYCYTGDVCTRDRCHLDGFDPPDADVLIVEATYGKPGYVFPDHDEIEREIFSWLDETMDRPVICVGYALGRAQKLQDVVARSDRTRCLVSESVAAVNEPIESASDASFDVELLDETATDQRASLETTLEAGDALVVPASVARSDRIRELAAETDALTAGFSGWAAGSSFRYRTGYDETFPLSDHCDFEELLALVEAVDPDAVYTQHGFADELAEALTGRGYRGRSLRRNQATLDDF